MEFEYKKLNKLEDRISESHKIRKQYPDKIPIICERDPRSNLPDINKSKFLVPSDLTLEQFNYMIRRRMSSIDNDILYLLVDGEDCLYEDGNVTIEEIYNKYKNYQDGLLYLAYTNCTKWLKK